MNLERCVDIVTDQLTATAALGDDRTRTVAAALATSTAGAVRLAVIGAVAAAADEVNAALLATSTGLTVSVHLDDDEPTLRVQQAPDAGIDPGTDPAINLWPAGIDDGEASARISLRLPETLKAEIDAAAFTGSISVNTWLVRAARAALVRGPGPRNRSAQHLRGWVTG